MPDQQPSQEEWGALYQAAKAFKAAAPWEFMYDSDLFGVQNPEDNQIGYCCVMGNLGEHFALGVYLGSAGLAGYIALQTGQLGDDPNPMAVIFTQSCLMASFEDREYLEKRDLRVIKSLGLKFRGRNAWPQFRNHAPGMFPWYLTAAEARFLALALEQALVVAERFGADTSPLEANAAGQYLVRVPEASADGLSWSDAWLAPAEPGAQAPATPPPELARAQQLKASLRTSNAVWEGASLPSPSPIQEQRDQRPYYPLISLWVDHRTGMVIGSQMSSRAQYQADFQKHFLDLTEQMGARPKEVRVGSPDAVQVLSPLADALGVRLRQTQKLDMLRAAYESMMSYFGEFE